MIHIKWVQIFTHEVAFKSKLCNYSYNAPSNWSLSFFIIRLLLPPPRSALPRPARPVLPPNLLMSSALLLPPYFLRFARVLFSQSLFLRNISKDATANACEANLFSFSSQWVILKDDNFQDIKTVNTIFIPLKLGEEFSQLYGRFSRDSKKWVDANFIY